MTKAPRYAAAGIAEYWQFDVNDRKLYVYRNPAPGGYPHARDAVGRAYRFLSRHAANYFARR